MMKLSFMTFVCPTWEIERAVAFARDTDYDGIELRVDAGHRHGISSQSSAAERRRVRELFAAEGVEVSCVATSCHFACPDAEEHASQLAAAKANLDLAADLGAPVVRIFAGGGIPALTDAAAEQLAAAFDEVGAHAAAAGVCPMLECGHDIIKGAAEAHEVVRRVTVANFGALWNHAVMDDETFTVLRGRIRHFHVHGGHQDPPNNVLDPANTALLDLARRMKTIDFDGYVSLEIIKGEDLPEDLLRDTATRLKNQVRQA